MVSKIDYNESRGSAEEHLNLVRERIKEATEALGRAKTPEQEETARRVLDEANANLAMLEQQIAESETKP